MLQRRLNEINQGLLYDNSRRKPKSKCLCKRKGTDMGKDEHYITCPVILTREVLAILGFEV